MARNQDDIIWRGVIRRGGVDWEFQLKEYLRTKHNLLVGRQYLKKLILDIGSLSEPGTLVVRGRNLTTDLLAAQEITCFQVSEALDLEIQSLISDLTTIFAGRLAQADGMISYAVPIPPELKPALAYHPIILTGEFSKLRGLDQMLQNGLSVNIVSETTNG